MISKKRFNKLKLKEVIARTDTDRVVGYEYLNKLWFGETYAFSHTLRLFTSPFKTKSIALSVSDFANISFDFLLGEDLKYYSTRDVCDEKFGEPILIEEFAKDRKTYIYNTTGKNAYEVGFTLLNDGGLAYFTMETADVAYNKALHRTSR
jgi:hypothetical protein